MAERLFVALDLPQPARLALAAFRDGLDAAIWRPVADEALHVTLAFLGSRPESDVEVVAALLEPAPAPELGTGAVALLPPRRPRVLALDLLDPDAALGGIQSRLSEALASAGVYTPERRPYRPHATVARLRAGARAPRAAPARPEFISFRGEAITLYRSLLHPRGARYEPLARVALAG